LPTSSLDSPLHRGISFADLPPSIITITITIIIIIIYVRRDAGVNQRPCDLQKGIGTSKLWIYIQENRRKQFLRMR
jgi:hypothetical protein